MAITKKANLDDGVAVLRPAFEKIIALVPKQAADRLFPFGITLIEARVNLATYSFELKIQGPDGKPKEPGI